MSTEPDELYTLRAQFWLGHYHLAIQEGRSVARRPMSPTLKAEREELVARAHTALGQYDKVTATDTPGLQALALKAQYEQAVATGTNESIRTRIVDQLKTLAQSQPIGSTAQLAAAHVLIHENQIAAAYQFVAGCNNVMEHLATKCQILLKIDRIDLAKQLVEQQMRTLDEDSILTQLCAVYVHLAEGRSGASDAEHTLNMLSEQYGPSPFLLNLTAAALLQAGDYVGAESKLQECIQDYSSDNITPADTFINLITAYVHQNKMQQAQQTVVELQKKYPTHPYHIGLERITSAFDREAIKYKA